MISFGYSLLTGVLLNFVAGVLSARFMIRSLSMFSQLRKPFLFGARRRQNNENIRNRWKFYLLSLAIMTFGIIMLFETV